MARSRNTGVALSAAFCMQLPLAAAAHAQSPAVSGPNGNIEAAAGGLDGASDAVYRLGGSVTLPVGHNWAFQADGSVQNYGRTAGGGDVQVFTRNPDHYLFGATASAATTNAGTLQAYGAEGEYYRGRFTVDGWAGYSSLDYFEKAARGRDGAFGMVDVGYYPTDNLRFSLGAASVLKNGSVSLGGEYQFARLPLSFTVDARIDEHGEATGLAGFKLYFGGKHKTLIERHRQDEVQDRSFDLFTAAGKQALNRPAVPTDFTNSASCTAAGFTWTAEHCT